MWARLKRTNCWCWRYLNVGANLGKLLDIGFITYKKKKCANRHFREPSNNSTSNFCKVHSCAANQTQFGCIFLSRGSFRGWTLLWSIHIHLVYCPFWYFTPCSKNTVLPVIKRGPSPRVTANWRLFFLLLLKYLHVCLNFSSFYWCMWGCLISGAPSHLRAGSPWLCCRLSSRLPLDKSVTSPP